MNNLTLATAMDLTAMTTALEGIKTDSLAALGAVAPSAIGIMGAYLVWRYGIKFFKGLAGK